MSLLKLKTRSRLVSDKLDGDIGIVEKSKNATEKGEEKTTAALSREDSQHLIWEREQASAAPPRLQQHTSTSNEARECKYLERIGQLERALEQSFNCLHELKQQLTAQHLLEDQLAAAEAFANLQQKGITVLKQQLAQQYILQTQLHHAYLELEEERDHSIQIEQQNIALQEQILQQYQQVGKYATAMQYWQEQALQLKAALAQLLPDCAVALSRLPLAVRTIVAESVVVTTLKSPALRQQQQVDLPPFLKKNNLSSK